MHCMQSNSIFPIIHKRSLDLLDGNPESPQEHSHKSKITLMSPKECEFFPCIPSQLEIMSDSPVLDLGNPPFPINKTGGLSYFRQLLIFPEAPVSSLVEHEFQHRNSKNAPWMPYHLQKRAHSQDSIEEVGQLSTSTSGGAFPQQ